MYYKKMPGVTVVCFHMIYNINVIDEETETAMQELYNSLMEKLKTDATLHPFQRFLFRLIRDRGGGCLGRLKKTTFLQMVESSTQKHYKLLSCQEWLMFDEDATNWLFSQATKVADKFVEQMGDIIRYHKAGGKVRQNATSSWPTSHAALVFPRPVLSSMVVITEMLVGPNNWNDAFARPRYVKPNNVVEAFADDYPPKDCAEAIAIIVHDVNELLRHTCGILLLDSNKTAFRGCTDQERRRIFASAVDLLIKNGFVWSVVLHQEEVILFMRGTLQSVLLHLPLGVAADSRLFITEELRMLRGFAVSVLANILRAVRGQPYLTAADEFGNPIYAMLGAHTVRQGFKHHLRGVAAFYRDIATPEDTNALTMNGLTKSNSDWFAPVAVRNWRRLTPNKTARMNDTSIYTEARVILTKAQSASNLFCQATGKVGPLGTELTTLLRRPTRYGENLESELGGIELFRYVLLAVRSSS